MKNLAWDRPRLVRQIRDRMRSRRLAADEARDLDEETELAFHRMWLVRDLRNLPKPRRRSVALPGDAASGVAISIDGLRSASGLNPLPRRQPN